jgi:hypothetical protein
MRSGTGETYIGAVQDGTVTLYHDNSPKLATTSTGINVTGTVTADSGTHTFGDGTGTSQLVLLGGTSGNSTLDFGDSADSNIGRIEYEHTNDAMTFRTNNLERIRIDSSGEISIGSTNNGTAGTLEVSIGSTSASGGITLWSPTDSEGGINFADGYTGADRYRGSISYQHDVDAMKFLTSSTERMRIDSSGRLLVGKTSTNFATEGVEIGGADGKIFITRDNNSLYLNRNSSDGNIVQFYKDSTEVGSIGAWSSGLLVGTGDVGLAFVDGTPERIQPRKADDQTSADGLIDLGHSSNRFKDLYLSGTAKIEKAGQALNLDTPSASQNVWMNFSDNGSAKWEIQKNTSNVLNIYSYDASSTVMSFDTAGHVTMPYQSAFLAKPTSNISNLTINVNTTVPFGTEIFDQNSDFASDTFTAPVTGKYQLSLQIRFNQLDVDGTFYEIKISTSNREYINIIDMRPADSDTPNYTSNFTILADMDAGDTAYVRVKPYNSGASQADIEAANTYFSGFLAC